jgi:hypothetical protein
MSKRLVGGLFLSGLVLGLSACSSEDDVAAKDDDDRDTAAIAERLRAQLESPGDSIGQVRASVPGVDTWRIHMSSGILVVGVTATGESKAVVVLHYGSNRRIDAAGCAVAGPEERCCPVAVI